MNSNVIESLTEVEDIRPHEITAIRDRHKLSMQVMADALGVHLMTFWRWENGQTKPPKLASRELRRIDAELTEK